MQKVLRKNIQDCAHPMTNHELKELRKQIQSPYLHDAGDDHKDAYASSIMIPLTEAEIDEAIRRGVPPRWRLLRKLPHVLVAWKLRLKVCLSLLSFTCLVCHLRDDGQDPGNAPVLGERVKYVVTLNGEGAQISAKAEPLEAVQSGRGSLQVDRHFYLNAFRKAADGLFSPIIEQRGGDVKTETERMLWKEMLEGRLMQKAEGQAERLALTPIAKAFAASGGGGEARTEAGGHAQPASKRRTTTKLTVNQAEHAQMKEQALRRKVEAHAKRSASLEKSPLLLAFSKQAAASAAKQQSPLLAPP